MYLLCLYTVHAEIVYFLFVCGVVDSDIVCFKICLNVIQESHNRGVARATDYKT